MCGNINEKHINLISLSTNYYIVLCVETLKCITVNVLCVETRYSVRLQVETVFFNYLFTLYLSHYLVHELTWIE